MILQFLQRLLKIPCQLTLKAERLQRLMELRLPQMKTRMEIQA